MEVDWPRIGDGPILPPFTPAFARTDHRPVGAHPGEPMLNKTQRRRLEVRFGRLAAEAERLLARIEAEPGSEPEREHRLARIHAEIRELIDLLHIVARRLDISLERSGPDLLRDVSVWAALSWTRVLDCRPSRFKGGGRLDPDVVAPLERSVDEVVERLEVIRGLASKEFEPG